MSISYSEIPSFLKDADLFKDLDANDDSTFVLPYYKENDKINNLSDLFEYMALIDFCCLSDQYISLHIYYYIFANRFEIIQNSEIMQFIINYKELKYLVEIEDDAIDISVGDAAIDRAIYKNSIYSQEVKLHFCLTHLHFCLKNNYLNCFKILIDVMYIWDEDTIILAIKLNQIEFLKILYNSCNIFGIYKTFLLTDYAINTAIEIGNIECLKYLFGNTNSPAIVRLL
jgi:hypothetical protein